MQTLAPLGLSKASSQIRQPSVRSHSRRAALPDHHAASRNPAAALSKHLHFVNLSNGIEAIPLLQQHGLPFSFVRIQSTYAEQQRLEPMMQLLDANLLLHLALGHSCVLWDYGSRTKRDGLPRAAWYGVEFTRYCLRRLWLGRCQKAYLRGRQVTRDFDAHVTSFSNSTKKRLRYFSSFMPAGMTDVHLAAACRLTEHDSDLEFHRSVLHKHCLQQVGGATHQPLTPAGLPDYAELEAVLGSMGYSLFIEGSVAKNRVRLLTGGHQQAEDST